MGAACLAVVVQSMKCDVNVGSPAGNVVLWWAGCGVLEMVNSRICAKYMKDAIKWLLITFIILN